MFKEYRQLEKGKIDGDFREELEDYSLIEGPLFNGLQMASFNKIPSTNASFA